MLRNWAWPAWPGDKLRNWARSKTACGCCCDGGACPKAGAGACEPQEAQRWCRNCVPVTGGGTQVPADGGATTGGATCSCQPPCCRCGIADAEPARWCWKLRCCCSTGPSWSNRAAAPAGAPVAAAGPRCDAGACEIIVVGAVAAEPAPPSAGETERMPLGADIGVPASTSTAIAGLPLLGEGTSKTKASELGMPGEMLPLDWMLALE